MAQPTTTQKVDRHQKRNVRMGSLSPSQVSTPLCLYSSVGGSLEVIVQIDCLRDQRHGVVLQARVDKFLVVLGDVDLGGIVDV